MKRFDGLWNASVELARRLDDDMQTLDMVFAGREAHEVAFTLIVGAISALRVQFPDDPETAGKMMSQFSKIAANHLSDIKLWSSLKNN